MKKMAKRLWSWLLAAAMLFSFVPMSRLPVSAGSDNTTEFAGGDGTEQNPYLIADKYQLNNVRNHLDAHFQMVADIEFTEADFAEGGEFYNGGAGWEPIGNTEDGENAAFTGMFDGDGNTITGLVCSGRTIAGLFHNNRGCIQNLGVIGRDVSATSSFLRAYMGSIAEYNNGTIQNCYNTGSMSVSSSSRDVFVGGIAGYNWGTINNCYNTGSVSASSSYAFVGGIAGYNNGTISNCYNTGSVSASSSFFCIGAIAGENSRANNGTINNCYYLHTSTKYLSNYSNGLGADNTYMAVCCTVEQMKQQETFVGFDFDTVWELQEGNTYPFPTLQWSSQTDTRKENISAFAGGTGTPYNPYIIKTKAHLNNVRNFLDSHFKMMADIEFDVTDFAENGVFYNDGQGWKSIGAKDSAPFFGSFDGNDHTIKGLICHRSDPSYGYYEYAGLFGRNQGFIHDLGVLNGDVSSSLLNPDKYANSYAGGIAGYNWGTISNCYNTGSVFASSSSLNPNSYAGGIAGCNKGTIQNCYNTGSVSASFSSSHVGGIAGYNGSTIQNCYNTGSVSASSSYAYAGGIAGHNGSTIQNCYNTGSVSAPALYSYAGRVAGKNSGTIQSCYYLNGFAIGIGGGATTAVRCTIDQMMRQGTFASGFDFDSVWTMAGNEDYLYPELQSVPMQFEKRLDSIAVITLPTKLNYLEGKDTLDVTGGKLILAYNNGTSEVIDLTAAMVSGFNNTQVGLQTLTVTHKGKNATFKVEIIPKSLVSIKVSSLPTKLEYLESKDKLDVTGGKLTLTYNNGTTEVIDLTAEMVGGFDNSEVGPQTLTVTYQGKTTTFEVEIIAKSLISITITKQPNKRTYIEGTTFDSTGMELTLIHDNGTTETITTGWQEEYDFSRPGEATVTITYGGRETVLPVAVVAKSVTEIAITAMPDKTLYLEGEAFDPAGLVITAYYDNGASEVVTDYQLSGFDSTPGAKTITVSFGDCTAAFTVTVQTAVVGRPTGDVSGDGTVDTTDARLTLQYAVQKITLDESQLAAADVNGDGKVDTTDARLILQYAVEKLDQFPVDN